MIKILLVDDELHLLEITKAYLEDSKEIEVVTSLSAIDAIEKIRAIGFDVIVSDYQMPDMNGIELLRTIRSQNDPTPFILFTGKGREEVVIDALNASADFYLQKGGDPRAQFTELVSMVKKSVQRRRMELDLVQNELKFETIFNSANDSIYILDPNGRIIEINDVGCSWLGFSREEMMQKNVIDLDTEQYAMQMPNRMKEVMEFGFALFETEWVTKSGKRIPIEISSRKIIYAGKPAILSVARDVSERKMSEEILFEKEITFRTVANFTYDWEYWSGPNGRLIYCSPSCKKISGYSSDDLTQDPSLLLAMIHPEDRPSYEKHLKKVGPIEPFELDFRIVTREGEIRWISHACQPVFDDERRYLGRRVSNRDITERKRTEAALFESEIRFRELFNNMENGIVIYEATSAGNDFIIRDFNSWAEKIEGVRKEDIVGRKVTEVFPGAENMGIVEVFRSVWKTGRTRHLSEAVYTDANNAKTWRENIVFKLPHGEIVSIYSDITKRKQEEEELRIAKQVFTDSIAAVGIADPKGIMTHVNERFLHYLGYSTQDEVVGRPINDFMIDKGELEAIMKRIDSKEKWLGDYQAKKKDGSTVLVHGFVISLKDTDGKPIGYHSTAIEITDQKPGQETSPATNVKLNILSNITVHDIQNQIVVLNGLVYKAKHANSPMQVKEYLSRIQQVADKIQSHVAFAREYQNLGKAPPSWIRIDAGIQDLASKFDSKWVQFEVDTGSLEVFSDAMLNRAFYNLIDDTLKHGQKATKVKFSAKPKGEELVLIYEDNGVGVPIDRKKNIFEKAPSSQKVHGLVLVKEILGITGMTIAESGEPGKGARFEIVVPKGNFRYPGNDQPKAN